MCCKIPIAVILSSRVEQCFLSDHLFVKNLEKNMICPAVAGDLSEMSLLSLPPAEGCHNRVCELASWCKEKGRLAYVRGGLDARKKPLQIG